MKQFFKQVHNKYQKKHFLLFTFLILTLTLSNSSYAFGEPEIVDKIGAAFDDIFSWVLKIATPAAAVAIATGIFMKKFSFGDEEKIRTGKKIIQGTLFSYCFLLATDLILLAVQSLIS